MTKSSLSIPSMPRAAARAWAREATSATHATAALIFIIILAITPTPAGPVEVPVEGTVTSGNLELVVTPQQPLHSTTLYTLIVDPAPSGPSDPIGLPLVDPFVSTFLTADTAPPVVASVSPADGALGVLPEDTVRVAFSESVVFPDGAFVLTDLTSGEWMNLLKWQRSLKPCVHRIATKPVN